jgi:hypothetical protein
MQDAFKWVQKNGGLCASSAYLYHSSPTKQGWCAEDPCTAVQNTALAKFVAVGPTEAALTEAVALTPVAVAIEGLQVRRRCCKSADMARPACSLYICVLCLRRVRSSSTSLA